MDMASFIAKYKDLSPAEILGSESLEQDLNALQDGIAQKGETMSADVQDVLRNIFAVLDSQIVQVNAQMKEQKGKMLQNNKNQDACLAYLQSASAKNSGRR